MRKVSSALLLTLLAVAPAVARAQATATAAHPDYTGTWVLDTVKSDKGQMIPSKMTLKIAQTPAGLTVDRAQTTQNGETTSSMKYALDGSASKNTLTFGGNSVDVSSVVSWQGTSQVITSDMKFGDNDAHSVETWSLADGGKTLNINRKISVQGQEFASNLVLVKQ
jgi:hypothetical protein